MEAASITSQMSMPMRSDEDLELIHQGDVDAAIDVFEQLGHLGGARGGDPHRAGEDAFVESGGELCGDGLVAADHLWDVAAGDGGVAGVFALRREGDVEDAVLGGCTPLSAP